MALDTAVSVCAISSTSSGLSMSFAKKFAASVCAIASSSYGNTIRVIPSFSGSRAVIESSSYGTTLFVATTGFTVNQALKEVFSLWGAGCDDCVATADSKKVSSAFNILNGCLQEIYVKAKSLQFLSNETITVSLSLDIPNNLRSGTLPANVQAVVGPAVLKCLNTNDEEVYFKVNGLREKSQIMNYAQYYNANGKAKTAAYYLDRNLTSSGGERTAITVSVPNQALGPLSDCTPDSITFDVEREIPRFSISDCSKGTPIPMPHQYCESLLLPLMREKAAASPFAARRDNYPMYQAEAAAARAMFAMTDPQNPLLDGTGAQT